MWYVKKNGREVSKGFPTRAQAVVEAFEKGLVTSSRHKTTLQPGVEIVYVQVDKDESNDSVFRQV